VVRLACSACTYRTAVDRADAATACPICGSVLRPSGSAPLPEFDRTDDQFLADVRDAFAFSSFSLKAEVAGWSECTAGAAGSAEAHPCAGALAHGSRLGDFEILEEVGRGGMGIVYRARQASLNREVALKVLPPVLHRRGSALRRFRIEAYAVARLNHPNVVPIYAQGEHDGNLYYAMELIDGVSLDVAIRSRPEMLSSTFWHTRSTTSVAGGKEPITTAGPARRLDTNESLASPSTPPAERRTLEDFRHLARLVAGAADGIAHANDHGVVHRDIKPHNLILGFDERLHITDFGLAHLVDEPHLTISGEVMGTPAYLSPEQVRGDSQRVDHRTDVYSLGATLYELLTHRRPFEGDTRDQILNGICTQEPPRPRRLDARIPRDLETICLRAMEKEPSRRFASASVLADDLRRFSDHRPIASRRVGLIESTMKWSRRHRAMTAAIAATSIALLLGGWLIQSTRTSRRAQAADLLKAAYDRLAYVDYRKPELVDDAIDQAEGLGADPQQLAMVQALAEIGHSDHASAIERLQALLQKQPGDARALYMLAWAFWRSGDRAAFTEVFERAEALGEPSEPDAWFFRGLAAHFAQPRVAVESYRQANALRAREHEFHPQAILHLARAHNQQMYVTRTDETFAEAEASLRQLIEHGHYGAYPYYLLSIAHRLAAESPESYVDGHSADWVSTHYREALQWAQVGQIEDPEDDRPVTAEAECLESLGRLEEAIEVRTKAIARAAQPREQWEGHHYRWRLHYWTNQFTEALADLAACAAFSPDSRFYAFVYPALVHAQMGETETALALARRLVTGDAPDARSVIWSATTLRLLGQAEEADWLLSDLADSVAAGGDASAGETEAWLELLYAFCRGEEELESLLAFADDATSPRALLGEAHFHAGAMALVAGRREAALGHFGKAYRCFDGESAYSFHANTVYRRMQADPGWPAWIAAESAENREGQD